MPTLDIYCGDAAHKLVNVGAESVQCCCTSPPYWGLRDYGVKGQLGQEKTPEEFVANLVEVFREVKRALRNDGTLWLNLGDSYAAGGHGGNPEDSPHQMQKNNRGSVHGNVLGKSRVAPEGYKRKDLLGIPWLVAKALQAPQYNGRITSELDRVWLAATIDAEGSICGFTHKRKDNGQIRRGIHLTVTNTNRLMLDQCYRIWPTSRQEHNNHGIGHFGKLDTFRWIAHDVGEKSALIAELYPYFVCKKRQALLAWNFLEISKQARGRNKADEGESNRERCAWIVHALSKLNHLQSVDVPDWIKEPPSLLTDGWYLRSEITWCKKVPMPESVTDRPTAATEKVFLLTKSARYFYNAEAVRNPPSESFLNDGRWKTGSTDENEKQGYEAAGAQNPKKLHRMFDKKKRGHAQPHGGLMDRCDRPDGLADLVQGSNMRNYWLLGPEPYSGSHFATFPTTVPRKCILAGTKTGDTVLDPFAGSGTTGQVALELGRNAILIELNPANVELCRKRCAITPGLQLA